LFVHNAIRLLQRTGAKYIIFRELRPIILKRFIHGLLYPVSSIYVVSECLLWA